MKKKTFTLLILFLFSLDSYALNCKTTLKTLSTIIKLPVTAPKAIIKHTVKGISSVASVTPILRDTKLIWGSNYFNLDYDSYNIFKKIENYYKSNRAIPTHKKHQTIIDYLLRQEIITEDEIKILKRQKLTNKFINYFRSQNHYRSMLRSWNNFRLKIRNKAIPYNSTSNFFLSIFGLNFRIYKNLRLHLIARKILKDPERFILSNNFNPRGNLWNEFFTFLPFFKFSSDQEFIKALKLEDQIKIFIENAKDHPNAIKAYTAIKSFGYGSLAAVLTGSVVATKFCYQSQNINAPDFNKNELFGMSANKHNVELLFFEPLPYMAIKVYDSFYFIGLSSNIFKIKLNQLSDSIFYSQLERSHVRVEIETDYNTYTQVKNSLDKLINKEYKAEFFPPYETNISETLKIISPILGLKIPPVIDRSQAGVLAYLHGLKCLIKTKRPKKVETLEDLEKNLELLKENSLTNIKSITYFTSDESLHPVLQEVANTGSKFYFLKNSASIYFWGEILGD